MKTDRKLKDFLAEAEDILESATRALVELEAEQTAGQSAPEQINSLFRAVHSFKGLSGMFELKLHADVSHKMEFLLDEVRLGRTALTRDVLDVLFDAIALLARLVQQTGRKQEPEDTSTMIQRVDEVLKGKPTALDRSLLNHVDIDENLLQVLTEYEEYRLKENIRTRKSLFILKVAFDLTDFESSIKKLNDLLKKSGEIICTLPSADTTGGMIGFTMIVGTEKSPDELQAAISIPNASLEPVRYIDLPRAGEDGQEGRALKSVSRTVRVDINKLDGLMNTVGEMHIIKNVLARIVRELKAAQGQSGVSAELLKVQRALDRKLNDLQTGILEVRMVPIGQIFARLSQIVRNYAKDSGKQIDLRLFGQETELDKLMIEDLADPLVHLIRNAVDHGIESPDVRRASNKPDIGVVTLSALPKGNHVLITIEDDGKGMDPRKILSAAKERGVIKPGQILDPQVDRKEVLDLIFIAGLSTSDTITEISGRGVGMDVVKKNISKLAGIIDIETEPGEGTRFTLTVPITLAIIKALIVESGGQVFAIPIRSVLEIIQASEDQVETVETREVMAVRDETVPLLRLQQAFNLPRNAGNKTIYLIVVGLAERRLGLVVEALRDQQEIVIKPMGKRLSDLPGIAGATELGDKRGIVLVLDVESLMDSVFKRAPAERT